MDKIINLLEWGLDGASARHRAIANNISNVDTPGYKRKDLNFKNKLQAELDNQNSSHKLALKTTNNGHISTSNRSQIAFRAGEVEKTSLRNDKNNVNIDHEMAELAKNNLYYNTLSRQISERFSKLKNVIEKGGK